MAYVHTAVATPALTRDLASDQSARRPSRGFFGRLFDVMHVARQRAAEREIALYLGNGGKFTDESEREIERRFLGTPSRW